ncbi:MAG: bifunctional pyr operon transcriptional regulator/uracil phosphoribosyltransferase PyrR [Turicibacter sp.]
MENKVLFDHDTITRSLKRIAHEVLEKNENLNEVVIIGIRTRGAYLATRLVSFIEMFEDITVPLGELDITKYRDDITREMKEVIVNQSSVPMTLNGKTVILVDDVLYTGRTVRAALEAVLEYGRPKNIQLAVLIDRGHRELPIRADYVGKNIPTAQKEIVNVYLKEIDPEDSVVLSK